MMRIMTEENFVRLNAEIEDAYRRRCMARIDTRICRCLRRAEVIALSCAANDARSTLDEGAEWLRRLTLDFAALQHNARRSDKRRRRRGSLIAANSPTTAKKRSAARG